MGEVTLAESTALPKPTGRSGQVGLLNLDKYRHSNLRLVQQKEVEGPDKPVADALSPDYKSLWSDVHIQGDYDQYARSTAKSKRRQSESSPVKNGTTTPSPRPAPKSDKPPANGATIPVVQSQISRHHRRTRIKLSKPVIHFPISNGAQKAADVVESKIEEAVPEKSELEEAAPENRDAIVAKNEDVDSKREMETANLTNDKSDRRLKPAPSETVETQEGKVKLDSVPPLTAITKEQSYNRLPPELSKSELGFQQPTAVSAMDLRPTAESRQFLFNNTPSQIGGFAIKDGKLEYGVDYHASYGALSRQSAIFMANYLELGAEPLPNMVTSIVVKPILPPLRGRNMKVLNRLRKSIWSKRKENGPGRPENSPSEPKKDPNPGPERDGSKLGSIKDGHKYVNGFYEHQQQDKERYDWELGGLIKKRHQLWKKEDDSIFDQVVRWRSKARHCSNPAMYRRTTSPTLGELALRRKMTDSLPTKQIRRQRPSSKELQPQEASESWRRGPAQETPSPDKNSAQAYAHVTARASMRRVGSIHKDWGARPQPRPLMEAPSILMDLPPPQMPVRKRRPVWQRMR